ncbi:MAG: 30S ribosomal protein S17e [Methanomicrobiales archaeon]|nr:30S ribosomal protein S17e [Methanomicrobiales archaeon]
MGIKPTYIKTIGDELLLKFEDRFASDFDENKSSVAQMANIGSKRVRNRIAGYITRKVHAKKKS